MKKIHITSFIVLFTLALISVSPTSRAGIARGSQRNTNTGNMALHNNTSGSDNTADGDNALFSNTTGNTNTAAGSQSLFSNTTGNDNTAVGYNALYNSLTSSVPDANGNTAGAQNTAIGSLALFNNTTGGPNTALGYQALYSNTTGVLNVGIGAQTLFSNFDGIRNVGLGNGALQFLTTGDSNTAVGGGSLTNSGTVNFNTALGRRALFRTQADQNTALGFFAGSNLRDGGTNNIYVGNVGPDPIGTESNTIRIGTQTPTTATIGNPPIESHPMPAHTAAYFAGIFGSTTSAGLPVMVDSTGKLGTMPSSERFKDHVQPMENASDAIFSLRPVTFRYKSELSKEKTPQFGLIAEEVAKVNPDLVVRDGKGEIDSVRYEAVNAMLLNEFIKEHRQVQEQQKQIDKLTAQLKEQAALIQKVSARIELNKPFTQTVADNQ